MLLPVPFSLKKTQLSLSPSHITHHHHCSSYQQIILGRERERERDLNGRGDGKERKQQQEEEDVAF